MHHDNLIDSFIRHNSKSWFFWVTRLLHVQAEYKGEDKVVGNQDTSGTAGRGGDKVHAGLQVSGSQSQALYCWKLLTNVYLTAIIHVKITS